MPELADSNTFQSSGHAAALSESEKRFATLYNLSPNVVILSAIDSGVICEVNRQFETMLGWPAAESIGRTGVDLGLWDDSEHRNSLVRRVMAQDEPVRLDVRLRARDGRLIEGTFSALKVELERQLYLLSTFMDN
ncbi:PAS domain-containing protein, partial [Pseudomonas quasicaspiana]|nr:PAS domain-containing protein [Pseudomonas quasicaspiana]